LVEKMQQAREEQWQAPPAPLHPETFANFLLDANAIHGHFLNAIQHVWHRFYAERAADDLGQKIAAAEYHAAQNYAPDVATIFRAVSGRTPTPWLSENAARFKQVELIPCCHLGTYVTLFALGEHLWIGFNANLVPVMAGDTAGTPMPIVSLYPAMKAFADEARLKIVAFLAQHGESNVGEIADAMGLTQSTASRHLSLLAKTDILEMRRDGAMRYYQLNPQAFYDIASSLTGLADQHD
jgi:ArsR family transcriptional regulator